MSLFFFPFGTEITAASRNNSIWPWLFKCYL